MLEGYHVLGTTPIRLCVIMAGVYGKALQSGKSPKSTFTEHVFASSRQCTHNIFCIICL